MVQLMDRLVSSSLAGYLILCEIVSTMHLFILMTLFKSHF